MFGIKHSGLQLQVLALYRTFLLTVRDKPRESRPAFKVYIREEFDRHTGLKRTDISAIEFLMRQAKKRLATLKRKEVDSVSPN